MKRRFCFCIFLLLILVAVIGLSACGESDTTTSSETSSETSAETSTATTTAPATASDGTTSETDPETDPESTPETTPETPSDTTEDLPPNLSAQAPDGLKVNLLSSPFGVDKNDLRFSWVMNDSDRNEKQTGYRIVVAQSAAKMEAKDYLFDSDWVASADNTALRLPALEAKLKENSLYYWRVFTRDTAGNEAASEAQAFSTAIGSKWANTNGIWAGIDSKQNGVNTSVKWEDYTVDVEFSVDASALGFVLRAVDSSNFYMWQFKVDGGKAILYPHVFKNGAFVNNGSIAKVEVPSSLAFGLGEIIRARIVCEGNTVRTYLADDSGNYQLIDNRNMASYGFTEGFVGVRTGRTESGKVLNMRVYTNKDNTVLYQSDFAAGKNPFGASKIENGVLQVPNAQNNGDLIVRANGSFVFLRSEISMTKEQAAKLDRAILSVTATSPEQTRQFVYNMYVNGSLIGVGPSRYGKAADGKILLYYNSYDVTDLLAEGKNCLSAINYTTNGHGFLCQLTLFYADGTFEILSNSGRDADAWAALPADDIFGKSNSIGTSIYTAHANNVNSAFYPHGFAEVGFDASDWELAYISGNIANNMTLTPSEIDSITRFENEEKVTVKKLSNGDYVIDLGGEIIGGVRITVDLPQGETWNLYYGEQLNANGTVKYNMNTGNRYVETWKLLQGKQTIETIDMLNYRYIQISGSSVAITPDMIKGLSIRAAFDEEESSFSSDIDLLNDIYDLMKRTIKMTTQDLYVDSQSRERLAYEGDLIINMLAAYVFGDDYSISRFTSEYLYTHRTWPAEYVLFTAMAAMNDYMATGDASSLEEYYSILKSRVFTQYLDPNYSLLTTGNAGGSGNNAILTDWPASERDGYDTSVKFNTVLNAVAVGAYEELAEIARITGHTQDAEQFTALAQEIKSAMIAQLYDANKGAFVDGMYADGRVSTHAAQHATAFALAFGIYEDQAMADTMAKTIDKQGEIRMSVYGAFFLLKGLYDSGNGLIANKLLLDPDSSQGARTWAYMLYGLGATITSEAWNSVNKPNMTLSHPWGAAPAYAIMNGIFGIKPTTAGYATFDVRFQGEGIGKASITVPTIKGSICASFEEKGASYSASVTVPANTEATVYIPAKSGKGLYLNGELIESTYTDGFRAVTVGSGEWQFEVK